MRQRAGIVSFLATPTARLAYRRRRRWIQSELGPLRKRTVQTREPSPYLRTCRPHRLRHLQADRQNSGARLDHHGKLMGPQAGRLSLGSASSWESFWVLKSLTLFFANFACGQRKPNKENARITLANETVRSLGVSVGLAFVLILSC